MNDKTLTTLTKIVGYMFAFFGALSLIAALTVLFGTGVAGYAQMLAQKMGKSVGDFPFVYAFIGVALTAVLGVLYLVASFGLLKAKAWAYKAVAAVGAVGIGSGIYMVTIGAGFNIFEFIWGALYLALAYQMSQKKALFKN